MTLAIAILGTGALLIIQYLQTQNHSEFRSAINHRAGETAQVKDYYGGDTPEETLRLFIDALKLRDMNLATQYFIPEKQEEWGEDLTKIKNKGLLPNLIKNLATAKKIRTTEHQADFTFRDETGPTNNLQMTKRQKWKIVGF